MFAATQHIGPPTRVPLSKIILTAVYLFKTNVMWECVRSTSQTLGFLFYYYSNLSTKRQPTDRLFQIAKFGEAL